MKVLLFFCLYILTLVSFMQSWLWLAVVSALVVSWKRGAVGLVVLAILLDGYYGNFYHIPYLSILTLVWFLLVRQVGPKLTRVNNQ